MGPSGRIRRRIRRRWGAVARTSCGATRACGSAARKGRLAGGVGIVGTVSFRKGRVQECRRRRSQLLASERAESFLLGSGRPSRESSESFQGFGSSKFSVERTLGYLRPPGWRPEDGGGDGSRQESASASGGTVQSDQRRGASETGTIPTARVCHKERIEMNQSLLSRSSEMHGTRSRSITESPEIFRRYFLFGFSDSTGSDWWYSPVLRSPRSR